MPDMSFFATREDLAPVLDDAEKANPIKYVAGRSLTDSPGVYSSHRDIPDLEFQFRRFFVVPRAAEYSVLRDEDEGVPESELYESRIDEDVPHFIIVFGRRLTDDAGQDCQLCGCIMTATQFSDDTYHLYHPFASAINNHLQALGWLSCWYGPGALKAGAEGCYYYNFDRYPALRIRASESAWEHGALIEYTTEQSKIPKRSTRIGLMESWDYLEKVGREPQRDDDGKPLLPAGNINASEEDDDFVDDDDYGISFLKEFVVSQDFSHLSLPKVSIQRSEIAFTSFHGSDLTGSRIVEADILECDLSRANLQSSVLGCLLYYCSFASADLTNAHLKGSTVIECDFIGATMKGCCVPSALLDGMGLSALQLKDVNLDCQCEAWYE